MKYVRKMPKTDLELRKQLQTDGWIKIKEPKNLLLAILFSFPFAVLLSGLMIWFGYSLKPELFSFMSSDALSITIKFDLRTLLYSIIALIYMFLHELIHAAFVPHVVKSDKTFWGLNGLFGFVFTMEPIKKGRFLLISCMPFFLLSLCALPLAYLCGFLNGYTFLLCLINAAGSCIDFLNMVLIASQVKRDRIIINNGFETYYSPT